MRVKTVVVTARKNMRDSDVVVRTEEDNSDGGEI